MICLFICWLGCPHTSFPPSVPVCPCGCGWSQVLVRQEEVFNELRILHRLPAAYKLCLAECVRRRAWLDTYCQHASRMADGMARMREKEGDKREAFKAQVDRCGGY